MLEQNYRNDPVSQDRLRSLYEGQTIEFSLRNQDGTIALLAARSCAPAMYRCSGTTCYEVDGKPQFGLPGQPIFPALGR